ncbi:hypothetical protein, partial [Actinotalea sp.]|uniref:hypothetical protein n=1 Tax=Actinotalea sp. TaxID=1872145 RepID=UPI003566F4C0
MTVVTELEPSPPAGGRRRAARRRIAAVAAAGLVLAGAVGYWALTPHLAIDPPVGTAEGGTSSC